MKNRKLLFTLGSLVILAILSGCGKESETNPDEKYLGESIQDVDIFPEPDNSFVGDPMPYYEDGKFNIFYLDDLRDGTMGYHPWSLYTTENFYEYENHGVVIPFGDSAEDQDIALGTGSVIKDENGLYHAFYTGHNDTYSPKEAIMHATSSDMLNWTKIPEDTFYSSENYSADDFRDPYVLYVEEENQYWMLITTRVDNKGVIAKYVSEDLKTWEDQGVFFENDMGTDSNLECPTLIEYGDKWYLSFSDQWPDRVVHYRVSDDIDGDFEKPEVDYFDDNGFYAGRMETDGENLYVVGWNPTKASHSDLEDYDWAGNLVVHQLIQREDGSLYPVVVESVEEAMDNEITLKPIKMTESIKKEKEEYQLSGTDYELMVYKELSGSYIMSGTIERTGTSDKFGFAFNLNDENVGRLNLVFDEKNGQVSFYNTDDIYNVEPQSSIDLDIANMDEIPFKLVWDDSVVSLYIDEHFALTARMYSGQTNPWGMFGIDSNIKLRDIELYK